MTEQQPRDSISTLVRSYENIILEGKKTEFTEADVGSKFILPLLEALGWDTKNIDEVKEQRRTLSGPVDYSLHVSKKPKLLVEIKKFDEKLDGKRIVRGREESFPEQAIRYAWHLKVDWVVLTNFEELRLYYSRVINPSDGLVFSLAFDRYLEDEPLKKLWRISKESVSSGLLDTYEKRRLRRDIDEEVLIDLFESRKLLVNSIAKNNPSLSAEEVKEFVQKILDRLLVIRVAEDRGIIGSDSLWKELDSWKNRGLPTPFMRSLKSLFRDFDEIYNSKLFEPHKSEDLSIDNESLEKVIDLLYKYNFDLISADVLGAIYEDYIGHIIVTEREAEEKGKEIDIVESYAERKKGGIYYTPTHIVEYIVERTVGETLKQREAQQVADIKIIDPACGSGSFLIKAYDHLKAYYERYNQGIVERGGRTGTISAYLQSIPDVGKLILTQNLFGVDLDSQASQIAAVNLMLKALRKGERLPLILGDNIKCGNSLISGSPGELRQYFGEASANEGPFEWRLEFEDIFTKGGFDVVIGNPPHGARLSEQQRKYFEQTYAVGKGYKNSASLFIEKASQLAKRGGLIGLVIPKSLTFSEKWKVAREFILSKTQLFELADISKAFPGVLLEQIILLCKNEEDSQQYYAGTKLWWGEPVESHKIPVSLCNELDIFPIHVDPRSLGIYRKISTTAIHFSEISKTFRGLPVQSKATKKRTIDSEPLLRGDDIKPYFQIEPQIFIDKSELKEKSRQTAGNSDVGGKVEELRRTPKIVSQRIVAHVLYPSDRIIIMSTLDERGLLSVDTVENTIITNPSYDPKYLLAFLNSRMISWYAYVFVFNKAVRTMDFDNYYVGKLPIYPAREEEQREIVGLVNSMLKLKAKLHSLGANFEDCVNEYPRIKDTKLQVFWRTTSTADREVRISSKLRGRIREVIVSSENQWLIFTVTGEINSPKGKEAVKNLEVLRIRIQDDTVREFLTYSVSNFGKNLPVGNVLERLLEIPIPRFKKDDSENIAVIADLNKQYRTLVNEYLKVTSEIQSVDRTINDRIYGLFGLSKEDIEYVEASQPSSALLL